MSVMDVKKNVPEVIEFYADKDFQGSVNVKVAGKTYNVWVKDGYAKVIINDLPVGNYTADAKYFGAGKYKEWNSSVNFEVY